MLVWKSARSSLRDAKHIKLLTCPKVCVCVRCVLSQLTLMSCSVTKDLHRLRIWLTPQGFQKAGAFHEPLRSKGNKILSVRMATYPAAHSLKLQAQCQPRNQARPPPIVGSAGPPATSSEPGTRSPVSHQASGEAREEAGSQQDYTQLPAWLAVLSCNTHRGLGPPHSEERGEACWVSGPFLGGRKVSLNGLGGGTPGQGSSTGGVCTHPSSGGQEQSGIPLSGCSDMCKGNRLSDPRADSRAESWGRGGSGCVGAVLGPGEALSLSPAWRGPGRGWWWWGLSSLPPAPVNKRDRVPCIRNMGI